MAFDLPRDVVIALDDVHVELDSGAHPFELAHREAAAAHWLEASAANPALFDGEIALLSSLRVEGRRLVGRCHITRYSTFLHWRRTRPGSAGHAYTHATLVASDGALVAARMGGHTANAGQVYFASGSFEPVDFRDGVADLDGNMQREVFEETGLDLSGVESEPGWQAVSKESGTVVFRRYFLDRPADEIAASISATVAAQDEPEISGPVIIRSATDRPQGLAAQMPDLIDWHFSTPRRR